MVAVFVAVYFAVAIGGGDGALMKPFAEVPLSLAGLELAIAGLIGIEPTLADAGSAAWLPLRTDQALALASASGAVLDAAWRPVRTFVDSAISILIAAMAVAAAGMWPEAATPAYAVIAALAVGDAGAAVRLRRRV
ncbi:MAG: hypothetical protein KTR21_04860 [Rhodobacteraceae bacterium]|nr:hypothetical protein [Paracoccaceae bacterium]